TFTRSGLIGWTFVEIGVLIAGFIARMLVAHHLWPTMRLGIRHVRRSAFVSLFSLGGKMFVYQVMTLIGTKAHPLIITQFFGPGGVALYTPGIGLAKLADRFVLTLRSQLFPLATGYHATGNTKQLHSVLIRGTKYTFLMGIGAYVILAVFAAPVMRLWLGRSLGEDYRIVAWVMAGWCIFRLLASSGGTQGAVLLGMNRVGFLVVVWTIMGIVGVLGSIWLVGFTSMGIVGTVVPGVVSLLILRPILVVYTCRTCGLSVRRYLREAYFGPSIVLGILVVSALAMRLLIDPWSLFAVGACMVAAGALWIPLCWWIAFDDEDRQRFAGLFGRILAKAGIKRGPKPATGPV
ncbi:hypothetical protein LCGC14_3085910, partial [marine sediment metagenome]